MEMNRRTFVTACFAASFAFALKVWRVARVPKYPGRVVPLDESALKKMAKWLG